MLKSFSNTLVFHFLFEGEKVHKTVGLFFSRKNSNFCLSACSKMEPHEAWES